MMPIYLNAASDVEVTIVGTPIQIMKALDYGLAECAVDELEVRNKKRWRKLGAEVSLRKLARSGEISIHRVSDRWYRADVCVAGRQS